MAKGLRLRGFGMALALDARRRVWEDLEPRGRDRPTAPGAQPAGTGSDPVQRRGDLPDRNAAGCRRLVGDGIDARQGERLERLEYGEPVLELPLELALDAAEGDGVGGGDLHGCAPRVQKKRRMCDALLSGWTDGWNRSYGGATRRVDCTNSPSAPVRRGGRTSCRAPAMSTTAVTTEASVRRSVRCSWT